MCVSSNTHTQSISKVVTYAYVHSLFERGNGEGCLAVHQYVGEEPSGLPFNAPVFDHVNRPHNPMVNAGAIMLRYITLTTKTTP